MRITSLSIILAVPFLLAMAIMLPMALSSDYRYLFPWLIIPVIILTSLYTFRPQIDYWWIKRQEIGLDPPLVQWLIEHSAFYNSLNQADKTKFEQRAGLFLDSKDFSIKASSDHKVPEQYKLLSIHEALRITWNSDNFLFKKYDRIILYPHAFPTPFHQYLHPVEVHQEDGVILLSQPHLLNGFLNPMQYFNVGLYAWIDALGGSKDDKELNIESDVLNQVYPYTIKQIKDLLGESLINENVLLRHAYYSFPNKMKEKASALYQKMAEE